MTLAVTGQDVMILGGMFAAATLVLLAATRCRLLLIRVGAVLAAAADCLGLVYFGWRPLFGGHHPPDTYFGTTMLFMGLLAGAILGAVEEGYRRVTRPPEAGRGFPVMPPRSDRSA